jgi:uncharacterized phage protein (TIGR01671 family)
MNREIKFRTYYQVSKRFLYHIDIKDFSYIIDNINFDEYPSFQQYTGLKDKTGKEIYEGDILKYKQHLFNIVPEKFPIKIKEVKWLECEGKWNVYETRAGESEIEVIGNIYENPELLNK